MSEYTFSQLPSFMKLTKGRISYLLLLLNILVGVPVFVTAYLSTTYYVVTTVVTETEGVDRIRQAAKAGYDYPNILDKTFRSDDSSMGSFCYKNLNRFKRLSDDRTPSANDLTDVFNLEISASEIYVTSICSSVWTANQSNSQILATMASTHYVETESYYKPQLCLGYIMIKAFAYYVWLIALPTLGYWLYVAFWPSKNKQPVSYDTLDT